MINASTRCVGDRAVCARWPRTTKFHVQRIMVESYTPNRFLVITTIRFKLSYGQWHINDLFLGMRKGGGCV